MSRDELIERHKYLVPLTRQRVYPVPPARIAAEDLEGEGYLGLVRAADRYDPARGTAFKSWAIRHIRGAMRDCLRREDYLTRPHREALRAAGEEAPALVSLDEIVTTSHWPDEKRFIDMLPDLGAGPEAEVCEQWESERVRRLIQWLPGRERQVIEGNLLAGAPCWLIGRQMGISETRCQQLQRRALVRLRRFLQWQRVETAE